MFGFGYVFWRRRYPYFSGYDVHNGYKYKHDSVDGSGCDMDKHGKEYVTITKKVLFML